MRKLNLIFVVLISITFALPALGQSKGDTWACTKVINGYMLENGSSFFRKDQSPRKLIWLSKTTFTLHLMEYENVSVYSKRKKKRRKTNNYVNKLGGLGTIYMTNLSNKFGIKLLILNEPQTFSGKFSSMEISWYHCSTS